MQQTKKTLQSLLSRADVGVLTVTLFLFLGFSLFTNTFLSSYNLFNLFRTTGTYIFIALAQAICLVVGGTNLAVGAVGGFSGVIFGILLERLGCPIILAIAASFGTGTLVGLFCGFIIVRLKVSNFVVSLAAQYMFFGLSTGITQGFSFVNLPSNITTVGRAGIANTVPAIMLIAITVLLFMTYLFKYTVTGRKILATGGNPEAARLSGINVNKIIILCNVMSGIFSVFAMLMYTTRLGSIQASLGQDWMMISFAVAVIGGTSAKGGQFSALGIWSAAFMITLINNGLTMMKVNSYYQQAFIGLIILGAIVYDSMRDNRASRMLLQQTMINKTKRSSLE